MLDFDDDLFRSLGCTIPLPRVLSTASNTHPASPNPYSHTKSKITLKNSKPLQLTTSVPQTRSRTTLSQKKDRKRNFTIFEDAEVEYVPPNSTTQHRKNKTRIPLTVKTDSTNSTPAPSPRLPVTPLPFSPEDAFWLDKENWNPVPFPTPPPTPTPAAFPHDPTVSNGPPPPPQQTARIIRPPRASPIPTPQNMVLYDLLGLDDWHVSTRAVRSAWRHTALTVHPDQAAEEERETATMKMQHVNAAREVLLSAARRRQYHVDGVLPWAV